MKPHFVFVLETQNNISRFLLHFSLLILCMSARVKISEFVCASVRAPYLCVLLFYYFFLIFFPLLFLDCNILLMFSFLFESMLQSRFSPLNMLNCPAVHHLHRLSAFSGRTYNKIWYSMMVLLKSRPCPIVLCLYTFGLDIIIYEEDKQGSSHLSKRRRQPLKCWLYFSEVDYNLVYNPTVWDSFFFMKCSYGWLLPIRSRIFDPKYFFGGKILRHMTRKLIWYLDVKFFQFQSVLLCLLMWPKGTHLMRVQ